MRRRLKTNKTKEKGGDSVKVLRKKTGGIGTAALLSALGLLLAAVLVCAGMAAAASPRDNGPSLFHNDEAWYKDETAPALYADGRFYIPSDILTMFDYISFTTIRNGENLLLTNSGTGDYLSILFKQQAACANGEILEDVIVFSTNGTYYLDAEFAAEHLGLFVEYSREENPAERSVRIYDNTRIMGFEELFEAYAGDRDAETDSSAEETEEEVPKEPIHENRPTRIFLVCGEAGKEDKVSALETAERLGFTCSLFLSADSELLFEADMNLALGLIAADAEEAEEVNRNLESLFYRKSHLILSTGKDEEDKALARAGYYILKPDFSVDKTTDASVLFRHITSYAEGRDYVTVWLGNVWQSETLLMMFAELDEREYMIGEIPGFN